MATIKNLVKFAAKFLDMAKSKSKDKKKVVKAKSAKPVAKAKAKHVAKKVVKPAKKAVKAKPVVKKKPTAKPVAKKVVKAVKKAKPVAKKVVKPVAKKKVVKVKPIAKKKITVKPVAKKKVSVQDKKKSAKKVDKKVAKVKPVAKKVVKAIKPVKPAKVKKEKLKKEPKAAKVAKVMNEEFPLVIKKRGRPSKPVQKKFVREEVKPEIKTFYSTAPKQPAPKVSQHHNIPVDMKHRYNDEDLKEFKVIVDKKLATAREELAYLKDALDSHTESQAGSKAWNLEEGADTSEMETMMNQISRQHQYIRNLELAAIRIENKTYGICRVTGKLIPKERLRVVPHATLSLDAKLSRKEDSTTTDTTSTAAAPQDFSEGFED